MKTFLLYPFAKANSITRLLAVFVLMIASVVFNQSIAQVPGIANIYPPTGGFEIEGDMTATPSVGDWLQGTGAPGGFVLNADGSPVNPLMTFHLVDAYSPALDNVFKGGKIYDNPNNMVWEMQTANGKSDMNHGILHLTVDSYTGEQWAIFSADRKAASGASYLDFEFLQNSVIKNANGTFTSTGPHGGRTIGDFIITAIFGNGSTTFQVWTWQAVGSGYSYVEFTGDLTGIAYAAENTSLIPVSYPVFGQTGYVPNTFVEGAMNLSGFVGLALPCTNTAINTLFIKTKASASVEATIQDFIDPIQLQALTIGSANAGDDQTLCDEGDYTSFMLNGTATAVMNYWVSSTTWSVVSYTGTQAPVIINSTTLTPEVRVYDGTAVIELTVETTNGIETCQVSDQVLLTVASKPISSWISPPGNITLSCAAAGNISPVSLSYSNGVTGQCSSSGSVMGVITGTYDECGGTLLQTWTFTDTWNQTITHVQTITVEPAPQAQFASVEPITITCNEATTLAASNLSYTNAGLGGCLIAGQVMGTLVSDYTECGGTITQNWTFTDDCGRTSTSTQVITVTPAPMAAFTTTPSNITISCDEAVDFGSSTISYTNAGLGGCLIAGTVTGVITGSYTECGGTLTQTWTFVDDCDRQIQHVQSITVEPAPQAQFASVEPFTITCNEATTFAATNLNYTNSGLGGCLISGQVMGTLISDYTECGGTITQNWTFTDDCGRTSTQTQVITVSPAPMAAFTTTPSNITISCDEAVDFGSSTISYTNAGLGGCLISGTVSGVITGSYTECGGTLTQTWTFVDDCDRQIQHVQTITVEPAPQAQFASVEPFTITCNEAKTFAASNLSYTNAGLGGCLIAGQVMGTLVSDYTECGGTITQNWTFTDDCGRTSTRTQVITVTPAPMAAFTTTPSNITISCDEAVDFGSSTISYTNAGLGGCLISGTVSGVITGSYTECGGILYQTWTFVDDCDRQIQHVQTITVEPAPQAQFASVEPITITCNEATTFAASNLSYTNAGLGGCLIAGQVMGTLMPDYTECGGTITQNWTFTDDCGRTSTQTQVITVSPAPMAAFTSTPEDITISCDAATTFASSTINYTNAGLGGCLISGTVTGVITGEYTECGGTLFQTWTFVDDCNRQIQHVQEITIEPAPQAQFASVSNIDISCETVPTFEPSYLSYTNNGLGGCLIEGEVLGVITGDATNSCNGILTQTWTFVDDCGRTIVQTQTINIYDNTAPTFTAPANTTIYTDTDCLYNASTSITGDVTDENDNCSSELEATFADVVTDGLCAGSKVISRTWSLVDDCGNEATDQVQTITVLDNIAPEVTTIAGAIDVTIQCSDAQGLVNALAMQPAATDNCSEVLTINLVSDITTPDANCENAYTRIRTWNFTDDCGNVSANYTQTINVIDNMAPVWTVTPSNLTVECDGLGNVDALSAWLVSFTGVDNCGDVTVTNNYTGLSDLCGSTGSATVTFTLSDDCGNAITTDATFTIVDTQAPVFTFVPAAITVDCGGTFEVGTPEASDDCSLVTITYLGEVRTDGNCENNYILTRSWSATDECGNASTATQIITVQDITPPSFTFVPEDLTVECDGAGNTINLEAWLNSAVAIDNCGEPTISNNYTGLSNECGNTGSAVVTFTANDGCGNTATATATFTVVDTQAPTLNKPANKTVNNDPGVCGAQVTLTPATSNDACGSVTITNNITGTNNASGYYQVGTTTIIWTAIDECGNVTTNQTVVTVEDNENPNIYCPQHITVNADANTCGAYIEVPEPIVNDNCGIREVTNTFTHTSNASATYPVGTTIVWWTVVDTYGNTDNCFMNITVIDNLDPVITCPESITVNNDPGVCEALVEVPAPVVTDNCEIVSIVNSYNGTENATDTYPVGTTTVTWTVTDKGGNIATCTMTITVNDTELPTIECPGNITVSADAGVCGANVTIPQPVAADNCDINNFTNDFNGTSNASGYYEVGTTTVTWTVTDIHGNVATCTMTVTVTDDEAPSIICPSNIAVSADADACGAEVTIAQPEITDNCDVNTLENNFNNTADASGFYPVGTTTVIWTVTDIHGNSAVCEMTVTVTDDVAPVITCPVVEPVMADQTCQATVEIDLPEAFDNCGVESFSNDFNNTANASGVYPIGSTVVTWTVIDIHGNQSTCSITVVVTAAPIAEDDYVSTDMNTPVTIAVLANDSDCDALIPSTVINTTNPANGAVMVNTATGEFIYTPNDGFTGTDSFNYTVCNASGLCDEATVTVTILQVTIIKLQAVNDNYSTLVNKSIDIDNFENDIIPSDITPEISILSQPLHGTLFLNSDMTVEYRPDADYVGTDSYSYILSDFNKVAVSDTAITTITMVEDTQRDTLIIYNVITPDNDGHNDRWIIEGIEEYNDNEVLLFNRWGDQVRQFNNYDNSSVVWDGTNKSGDLLPSATYYYIVRVRAIEKVYTGWVIIHGHE